MTKNAAEIRAFIAIELPEPVKAFLDGVAGELQLCRADVKWVKPAGMHLTLKFLGSVRTELLPAICEELEPAFGSQGKMELQVRGVGAFPGLGRPRVIWAGLNDLSGRLAALAEDVDHRTESLGFPREKRAFSAHLTLGRIRSNTSRDRELAEAVRQKMDLAGPRFVADHAILFESVLKPSGAEYSPVFRFDFSE